MDREELLGKYAGGEKDFTGQRFGGLRDRTIKGGIYGETDFSGSYFEGVASLRDGREFSSIWEKILLIAIAKT